jgi:putative tricarboxylic transport membrane protein
VTGAGTAARTQWREVTAFGLLTALGVAAVASSFSYGVFGDGGRVGPGFLPLVTGGLLALLGGAQLVERLRATPAPEPEGAPAAAEDGAGIDALGRTEQQRVRQLWMVAAAILVAIPLVTLLGFLIAFGLLVLFVTTVVERRPLLPAAVITLAAVGLVYGVFGLFLNVPLPLGLFEMTGS